MSSGNARSCLRGMIHASPVSLLVTNTPDGSPAVRPLQTLQVDEHFAIWYATGRSSGKCTQIAADNRVTVYWQHVAPDRAAWDYGCICGTAEVLDDQQLRDRFWEDEWTRHFPGGKTDPEYVLIKVTPKWGKCTHMPDLTVHTTEF